MYRVFSEDAVARLKNRVGPLKRYFSDDSGFFFFLYPRGLNTTLIGRISCSPRHKSANEVKWRTRGCHEIICTVKWNPGRVQDRGRGHGQGRISKRDANFSTTYVIIFSRNIRSGFKCSEYNSDSEIESFKYLNPLLMTTFENVTQLDILKHIHRYSRFISEFRGLDESYTDNKSKNSVVLSKCI